MNETDIRKIIKLVHLNKDNVVKFLRDIIAIPSPSGKEKDVVNRIAQEMKQLGYDEIFTDKFGNVIGRIGNGKKRILFDSHIDTVGVTDPNIWKSPPFHGMVKNEIIYGRGTSDNKGATAPMVYAGKIIKEICPNPPFTLFVVGSVQEEDCDGLALGYAVTKTLKNIDCVILGECTDLNVNIGHRGRMEIILRAKGKSAHASKPERGINAVYKMTPVIDKIKALNKSLKTDKFLGKGSIAVTKIDCKTDSLNCVPYECTTYLDRRLTKGENKNSALNELKKITKGMGIQIEVPIYDHPSHTGMIIKQEKYFPTWLLNKSHPLVQSAKKTYQLAFKKHTKISKWIFSTNGVSTMGRYNIPTIGFGPSSEKYAHTINDQCKIDDLIISAIFYSLFPFVFAGET